MSQTAATPPSNTRFYDFGPFRVDSVNRLLLRDRKIVSLTSKVFDILLVFVSNSGQMLDKEELMKQVWPESFVEEGNLTRNVSTLRKALGESPQDHQYIVTIPGRGYRFAAKVTEVRDERCDLIVEEHSVAHIVIEHEEENSTNIGRVSTEPFSIPARKLMPASHRQRITLLSSLIGSGLLVVGALTVYWTRTSKTQSVSSFSQVNLTSLTTTGDVYAPTISPNGKFLAYSSVGSEGLGLRVRQIATGSILQLVPPGPAHYWGITFSRDSDYVYYVLEEVGTESGAMYRVPTLGGHIQKLIDRAGGGPIMSPDGRFLAYGRGTAAGAEMVVTDIEGKNEHIVIPGSRRLDFRSADWSPDSKSIAYVIHNQSADGQSWHVTEIPIDGGNENQIVASRKTRIVMIVWLPDRSGLIMNAIDPETNVPQISFVSYPTGEERRITHDLNNYKEISVTADSRMIVAQKMGSLKQLWIAPERDSAHARLLSTATGLAYHSLSWAPHSQLVFDAEENGEIDIWKMSLDGGGREQLTHHEGQNTVPGVMPDGRYIVFLSTRTGSSQLWRMDADGNNPKQLTNSLAPVVELQSAPEGGWIFYKSYFQGQGKLFKIPIDGGEAIRVPHDDVQYWAISPNGKLIAYSYLDSEAKKTRIIVAPLAGGVPLARFDVEPDRSLQWINAGSGLAYVGLDNRDIWVQQLAGGPPRQVTNLQPDLSLINFTWSDDTKQLAYTRGAGTFDAVAISLK